MNVMNKWSVIAEQCKHIGMEEKNYMIMDSYEDIKSYMYPIPDVNGAIRYRPEIDPFFGEMDKEPEKYFEVKMVSNSNDVMFGIVNRGRYVIKKTIHIDANDNISHGFIIKQFEQLINGIDSPTIRNYYKSILIEMN